MVRLGFIMGWNIIPTLPVYMMHIVSIPGNLLTSGKLFFNQSVGVHR
jgi:hypothetical protein